MREFIRDMWSKGLDLIYPASAGCPLCGGGHPCACREELLRNFQARRACWRCGKFLPPGSTCLDCQSRGSGFPERVYALAPYDGGLRRAIHSFKYRGDKRAGRYLAELLWAGPGSVLQPLELIIPVPLHQDKQYKRGFNQAVLLADYLGSRLSVETAPRALVRTVNTQPQAELTRGQRRQNLANAFCCQQPEKVRGKHLLLVDDIITTGFTLEGCGNALRAAGARSLTAVCLAAGRRR